MTAGAPELSWAPRLRIFARRSLITNTATFAVLAVLGLMITMTHDLASLWVLPTAALMTLGFLLEDLQRWQNNRDDRWHLREGQLIHDGSDGTASIPLTEISRVTTRFGGTVIVRLASGQRIDLRYLPFPKEAAAQIDAARPGPAPTAPIPSAP